MDKKVDLKKTSNKRKNPTQVPSLTNEETLHYLRCYFIEEELSSEDKQVMKQINSEIKKKRTSYKSQDGSKKKYNESTFISENEIYEKLLSSNMKCYYCRSNTCIFYNKVRQPDQWTLERIDNLFGHSNINTVISCLDCNLKRRDKNSNAFQFAKQLVIKKI